MNEPLRGVNLGGWLVLEKWITPSLFKGIDAVDEYTYCTRAGNAELKRLKDFRDTWITKDDFVWLRAHGVQAVRLPIGHWMFGDEKPYVQTVQYVDKAFEWAEATDIKVLLDLHGLPGSQNGKFHSGKAGSVGWLNEDADLTKTLKTVEKLAKRYGNGSALLGLSLLNEPSPDLPKQFVLRFYKEAYRIIRNVCGEDILVVYSQGFRSRSWRKELRGYKNVLLDYHHYQNFRVIDRWLPLQLQVWRARRQLPIKLWWLSRYHRVVIGEWSLVYNGRNKRKLTKEKVEALSKAYGMAQLKAFDKTKAHFYWTYKTESESGWSYVTTIKWLKK